MKRLLPLLFWVFPMLVFAQDESNRAFRASVLLGFNATQLDGDQYRGYDKVGLHGGLGVSYRFPNNPKLGLGTEIIFSAEGSSEKINFSSSNNTQGVISLNYIRIPLLFSFREWKFDFHAGASYGRLIGSDTNEFTIYLADDFRQDDIGIVLGASYMFTDNWALTFRFSRSVMNTVKPEINRDALNGHFLTFRVEYRI